MYKIFIPSPRARGKLRRNTAEVVQSQRVASFNIYGLYSNFILEASGLQPVVDNLLTTLRLCFVKERRDKIERVFKLKSLRTVLYCFFF